MMSTKNFFAALFVAVLLSSAVQATDTTPPAITITYPAQNTVITDNFVVQANVSDDTAINYVYYYMTGQGRATSSVTTGTAPYSATIDITPLLNGAATLVGVARDTAGNQAIHEVPVYINKSSNAVPKITFVDPAVNQTVIGNVTVRAQFAPSMQIQYVYYYLAGQGRSTPSVTVGTAPYTTVLDSTYMLDGNANLAAVVVQMNGSSEIAELAIKVNNSVPDTTPPVVAIVSPAQNAVLSGEVNISASATDNSGSVKSLQFYIDGVAYGTEVKGKPFIIPLNTASFSAGQHNLTVLARDANGNSQLSNPVLVTLQNTTNSTFDSTFPTVSIAQPIENATVTGSVTLSATAADNSGTITEVRFFVEDASTEIVSALGFDSVAPYAMVWNASSVASGQYRIGVTASDPSNNVQTATPVLITVDNTAPSTPANLTASGVTATQATISWVSATDNVLTKWLQWTRLETSVRRVAN
jgi:hypothetical protein